MAAQDQSGTGTQTAPPATPAAPALPALPGVPDVDAINRAVEQKLAEKGVLRVEQARQRLEQAKDKLLQASKSYSANHNSENKGRLTDAKAEVKDAARDYEEAISQSTSGKWTGQNGITVDLGGSRRHSSGSGNEFLAVPIVAIICVFFFLIVRTIMAPFTRRNRVPSSQPGAFAGGGFSQDEVALIQKMQRTLHQMETRVEALETILIEQQQQSSARSRRMAGATVGATARAASAPSSATLRTNPNI